MAKNKKINMTRCTESFQTKYEFTLPKGYLDLDGKVHKQGIMRLATAADEIIPLKNPKVKQNPAYLTILLLSRVISKLGTLRDVNPRIIEGLFSVDLAYLEQFYELINNNTELLDIDLQCPHCLKKIFIDQIPVIEKINTEELFKRMIKLTEKKVLKEKEKRGLS